MPFAHDGYDEAPRHSTDLLLIHTSQGHGETAYPYLLVQLTARARHAGLSVARIDVSHDDAAERERKLRRHLAAHQPRFVCLTLRRTEDSLAGLNGDEPEQGAAILWRTRATAQLVRKLSRARLLVAGRGFEQNPEALAAWLGVDFGINGDSKPVFAALAAGTHEHTADLVPNLVHRRGRSIVLNRRLYLPPHPHTEYDDPLIDEIIAHYEAVFSKSGHQAHYLNQCRPSALGIDSRQRQVLARETRFPMIPIEIARGCPHHCRFCSEPQLAGTRVRQRPLAVVESEIRAWVRRGLRHFWLLCGELNTLSTEYLADLTALIQRLNHELDGHPIQWQAFQLPQTSSLPPLARLYDSGFVSSSVELPTLAPALYQHAQVPFRHEEALNFLRVDAETRRLHHIETRLPLVLQMFAAELNPEHLVESLARLQSADLDQIVDGTRLLKAVRMFPNIGLCRTLENMPWFRPEPGPAADATTLLPENLQPVYLAAPALRTDFGSGRRLDQFLAFIANLMSSDTGAERPWPRFLNRSFRQEDLQRVWLAMVQAPISAPATRRLADFNDGDRLFWSQMWKNPHWHVLTHLLEDTGTASSQRNQTAFQLATLLVLHHEDALDQVCELLQWPTDKPLWRHEHKRLLAEKVLKAGTPQWWRQRAGQAGFAPAGNPRRNDMQYVVDWLLFYLHLEEADNWSAWLAPTQEERPRRLPLSSMSR